MKSNPEKGKGMIEIQLSIKKEVEVQAPLNLPKAQTLTQIPHLKTPPGEAPGEGE